MSTPSCPICKTPAGPVRRDTPYFTCNGCGLWFQHPAPPKTYHAEHEHWLGKPMPEDEKRANEHVARFIFDKMMACKPGLVVDIGCAYPYLLRCMRDRHGCRVVGLDGDALIHNDLDVLVMPFDLDRDDPLPVANALVMIHAFEHVYDPIAGFRKLRSMVADDGGFFLRMPDSQVAGIERDLTPGHYTIHPFVHSLTTIAQLCAQTETFVIEQTWPLEPGQRDLILRPTT
jgi:Methyltransferase domain